MNNVAERVRYYEGLELDHEVQAMHEMRLARQSPAYLVGAWHAAAAREAGQAGLYGRKADELRGI